MKAQVIYVHRINNELIATRNVSNPLDLPEHGLKKTKNEVI